MNLGLGRLGHLRRAHVFNLHKGDVGKKSFKLCFPN